MRAKSLISYLSLAAIIILLAIYLYIGSAAIKVGADLDRAMRIKGDIASLQAKLVERQNSHAEKLELSHLKSNLGRLYLADRNYKQAEDCFIDSANRSRGLNGEVDSARLLELADLYRQWQRFALSDTFYRAVLLVDRHSGAVGENLIARDLNNLAVLHLIWAESIASASASDRHFDQAKSWLKQAKQLAVAKSPRLSLIVSNNLDQALAEEKLKR